MHMTGLYAGLLLVLAIVVPGRPQEDSGTGIDSPGAAPSAELADSTDSGSRPAGYANELQRMRDEVRLMRAEAEKLGRMAQRLEDEADAVEKNVGDLLERATQMAQRVEALGALQDSGVATTIDSADQAALERLSSRQLTMSATLRENAAILNARARDMSLKVRDMEELARFKREAADSVQEALDKIERSHSRVPLPLRHRWSAGGQSRLSLASFEHDRRTALCVMGGVNTGYTINEWLAAGMREIMFYLYKHSSDSIEIAAACAPTITAYGMPFPTYQLAVSLSLGLQAQLGAYDYVKTNVVPSVMLSAQKWIGTRFSIGPLFAMHVNVHGDTYLHALPFRSGYARPQGAFWSDGGVIFSCHW